MMIDWVAPEQLSHRLDCHRYQQQFVEAESRLRNSGVPVSTLEELRDPRAPINNSLRDMTHALADHGVPVIRGTNISPPWVDENDLLFIRPDVEVQSARSRLKGRDLVISIAGTLGATGIVPDKLTGANINSSCARFRAKDPDVAYFLAAFLNTALGQAILLRESVGSVQRHLNLEDLPELLAPIPEPEIRRTIADKLRKAERLRSEVTRLVSGAVADVEALLNGTLDLDRLREEGQEVQRWLEGDTTDTRQEAT
jgi:type I restriction enzyme S subunit